MGLLSHVGPASRPYQVLSQHTIGGFRGNNSVNTYFHLLLDHFTRFAFIKTFKTQSTKDYIKLLAPVTDKSRDNIGWSMSKFELGWIEKFVKK